MKLIQNYIKESLFDDEDDLLDDDNVVQKMQNEKYLQDPNNALYSWFKYADKLNNTIEGDTLVLNADKSKMFNVRIPASMSKRLDEYLPGVTKLKMKGSIDILGDGGGEAHPCDMKTICDKITADRIKFLCNNMRDEYVIKNYDVDINGTESIQFGVGDIHIKDCNFKFTKKHPKGLHTLVFGSVWPTFKNVKFNTGLQLGFVCHNILIKSKIAIHMNVLNAIGMDGKEFLDKFESGNFDVPNSKRIKIEKIFPSIPKEVEKIYISCGNGLLDRIVFSKQPEDSIYIELADKWYMSMCKYNF